MDFMLLPGSIYHESKALNEHWKAIVLGPKREFEHDAFA
jgi:hypothetical protein